MKRKRKYTGEYLGWSEGGGKVPLNRLGGKIRLRPGLRFMLTLTARKWFWQSPRKCTGLAKSFANTFGTPTTKNSLAFLKKRERNK